LAIILAAGALMCACRNNANLPAAGPLDAAYDSEQDPNDPQRLLPLDYEQAQGKRIFYDKCVWCHSDSTPAGPSNRTNLTPQPPSLSDGNIMNPLSQDFVRNIVLLGGSALGKSAMMPPWGNTLSEEEIQAVIAYSRRIASPAYGSAVSTLPSSGGK
jgi:cytochrome c oxidase cbb3-type subunit 3